MHQNEKLAILRRDRSEWDARWARPGMEAFWLDRELPPEVESMLDDGWLLPGETVLDVGCGDGRIAGALARRGFKVTGIDSSHSAIRRGQRTFLDSAEAPVLRVFDICSSSGRLGRFDTILDRGCLHCIPEAILPDYFAGAARQLKPGGQLCVLYKTSSAAAEETAGLVELLSRASAGLFECEYVISTEITGQSSAVPAVCMRMRQTETH